MKKQLAFKNTKTEAETASDKHFGFLSLETGFSSGSVKLTQVAIDSPVANHVTLHRVPGASCGDRLRHLVTPERY